jgi:MFS transporter, FHS family, glucose/mannose:H+ symporter
MSALSMPLPAAPAARPWPAIGAVYLSGLAQGIALVTFPAAGNRLRSSQAHALTSGQYGTLFLAMFAVAVLVSASAGPLSRRLGQRVFYLVGMTGNLAAMLGLAASQAVIGTAAVFPAVLAAIAALGLGFGATLTVLNGQARRLVAGRDAAAVTALHTLVGLGTALPPLLLPLFAPAVWWLFPLAAAALLALLMVLAVMTGAVADDPRRPVPADRRGPERSLRAALVAVTGPALAAFLYGVCEALLSNWGTVFLHEERALSSAAAGRALSAFWLAVTAGRLITVVITRWVLPRRLHRALSLVIALALLATTRAGGETAALVSFAVAGLGCSAFLPLTISLASARAGAAATTVSGLVFAGFLTGSGLGSFGVGLIYPQPASLSALYTLTIAVALGAGAASWRWLR